MLGDQQLTARGGARRRKCLSFNDLHKKEFLQRKSLTGCPVKPFVFARLGEHGCFRILHPRQRDASERVEKSVERVAPLGQCQHVAAHDVGERVVQAPQVALLRPLCVFGSVPLVENVRQCRLADRANAIRFGDEVMRLKVVDGARLVSLNALGVVAPSVQQLAECARKQHRQVAQDELGVTTSDLDLVVEGEIVADERSRTSVDASGERLVMRVTQADHSADVLLLREVGDSRDLEQAEVAQAVASKGVSLLRDGESSVPHDLAQTLDQSEVRDGHPRIRGCGSGGFLNFRGFHGVTAAVQC